MKRILCLLSVILIFLSGCTALNAKDVKIERNTAIPADGIIAADIFAQLKKDNGVIRFTGESNGIRYQWTVFGKNIDAAKDLNLSLEITAEETEKLIFRYNSEQEFGFSPLLTIYLQTKWDADDASAFSVEQNARTFRCDVSITGDKTSVLNLSDNRQTGTVEITANRKIPDAAVSADETQESADNNALPSENSVSAQQGAASGTNASVGAAPPQNASSDTSEIRSDSDGTATEKDAYQTDPVPAGKPLPVEPDKGSADEKKTYTCTFSIECSTILNNLDELDPDKCGEVPSNGIILPKTTVTFYEGESVYDVLQRVCKENKIHMEASWTPIYNSAYVEGIHNLYELDCGACSGWMYRVDGWYPNYGCSRYQLKQGETVEWRYSCDLGKDIGGGNFFGE